MRQSERWILGMAANLKKIACARSSCSLQHEYVSEDAEDQIKEIGLFSSRGGAQEAIERLRAKPRFRDHPEGFKIYEIALDCDLAWEEGFVRVDPDEKTDRH